MAFVLTSQKNISQWVKHESGAEFKIRNINHKAYQVGIEIAQGKSALKPTEISKASENEKLQIELLYENAAYHLIEDWKNVEISVDGEVSPIDYTPQNALRLMIEGGEAGAKLWEFIILSANEIQEEADNLKKDLLGKSKSSTSTVKEPKKATKSKD